MKPHDLIQSGRVLLKAGNSRPSQANLRRAISAGYYALFHCLARSCADLLVGGSGAARSQKAWQQTYRALDHGIAKSACSHGQMVNRFPDGIRDFANTFVTMQDKRHGADYDPLLQKLAKSEVVIDLDLVEQAISDFQICSNADRRAFCIYVLFKKRPR